MKPIDFLQPTPNEKGCTIITTRANDTIKPLHNRMPMILSPEMYRWWLNGEPGSDGFMIALDRPLTEPLKIYPVSTQVNSARVSEGFVYPLASGQDHPDQRVHASRMGQGQSDAASGPSDGLNKPP